MWELLTKLQLKLCRGPLVFISFLGIPFSCFINYRQWSLACENGNKHIPWKVKLDHSFWTFCVLLSHDVNILCFAEPCAVLCWAMMWTFCVLLSHVLCFAEPWCEHSVFCWAMCCVLLSHDVNILCFAEPCAVFCWAMMWTFCVLLSHVLCFAEPWREHSVFCWAMCCVFAEPWREHSVLSWAMCEHRWLFARFFREACALQDFAIQPVILWIGLMARQNGFHWFLHY